MKWLLFSYRINVHIFSPEELWVWVYVVSHSTGLFLGRSFDISQLLSVTRQPEVGVFHSWEVGLLKFSDESSL